MITPQEVRRFAQEASRRVQGLREGSVRAPTAQVLQELETVVEELQVSGEEMRVQNEELLGLVGELDGQRSRTRGLFELAPTPLLVTDLKGYIRDVNLHALHMIGVPGPWAARKPLAVFVAPDARADFRSYLERVRRSGPGGSPAPGDVELLLRTRGGAFIPVLASTRLVPGEGCGEVLWSLRDLRPQREREEARARLEAERAGRAAAEASSRHVLFLLRATAAMGHGSEPREVARRAAELAAEEFCALAVVDVVAGEAVERVASGTGDGAVADAPASLDADPLLAWMVETGSSAERRSPGEDDAVRRHVLGEAGAAWPREGEPAAVLAVPMIAPRGVVGTLTLVGEDEGLLEAPTSMFVRGFAQVAALALAHALRVRDLERQRAHLDAVSQERTHALVALSHEMRTPLQSVLGYCELLLDDVAGDLPRRARRMVEAVRASARHQADLANGVLDLFRSGDRQGMVHPEPVDVAALVGEAATLVAELARRKELELRVDVDEGAACVTDPAKLRQVLVNLLGNAVKYTEEGHVRVAARRRGGSLEVAVEDTGRGIARDDLARVFEPFWRAAGDNRGGSGLGLSVTRELVQLLGGRVDVESEEGKGTAFHVSIPAELTGDAPGAGADTPP